MDKRKSGILMHITSLPSKYGIGDLGPEAYGFADFLEKSGQSIWQILPLSISDSTCGNSPYFSISAFAMNPLVISPELLVKEKYVSGSDIKMKKQFSPGIVDFEGAAAYKAGLLEKAFRKFSRSKSSKFNRFCTEHEYWLEDYALFAALRQAYGNKCWNNWPAGARDRSRAAIDSFKKENGQKILKYKFIQYLAFSQWFALKKYCNKKGIEIVGDLPIYVSLNSADVWVHPANYRLDKDKKPVLVSGVPPDYFSKTGQLWGNPVYDWNALRKTGFKWWIERMKHNLKLCDIVRIDHFRGLVAYWVVGAEEKTAMNGRWVKAPARDFFSSLKKHLPSLPVIAEDLGSITPDVRKVLKELGFPGMKIIMFGFRKDNGISIHMPQNYVKNCAVYTGTHDNNTVKGWYEDDITPRERKNLKACLGKNFTADSINWELIRFAMLSVADTVIVPVQDILSLGSEARMNHPGRNSGNWRWRMARGALTVRVEKKLSELTRGSGRNMIGSKLKMKGRKIR